MNPMQMLMGLGGLGGLGGLMAQPKPGPKPDTAETIYISSLALLKMLKHSKAGVPLEVMGLMLGEFIDDYTIKCVDVFSMPQSASGEAVEAVDDEFQSEMLEMLKQTGRQENMIGWYHSHPSFGPWLSSTDQNSQQSYERLISRCVALVIDPIQSVRGKVVWDAFRLIDQAVLMQGGEARQTTSNLGHLNPLSLVAQAHGAGKFYYSINIKTYHTDLDKKMLISLYQPKWSQGFDIRNAEKNAKENGENIKQLGQLAKTYVTWIDEEQKKSKEELALRNVGKVDPKRAITEKVTEIMSENVLQILGTMVNTKSF